MGGGPRGEKIASFEKEGNFGLTGVQSPQRGFRRLSFSVLPKNARRALKEIGPVERVTTSLRGERGMETPTIGIRTGGVFNPRKDKKHAGVVRTDTTSFPESEWKNRRKESCHRGELPIKSIEGRRYNDPLKSAMNKKNAPHQKTITDEGIGKKRGKTY